jgi:outer membrane protein TolC
MDEALSEIAAAERNINSAQRAFEIAESRVANGLSTQLELKDSRIFLDQARITRLTAIYAFLDAYFDWELLTGNVTYPTQLNNNP